MRLKLTLKLELESKVGCEASKRRVRVMKRAMTPDPIPEISFYFQICGAKKKWRPWASFARLSIGAIFVSLAPKVVAIFLWIGFYGGAETASAWKRSRTEPVAIWLSSTIAAVGEALEGKTQPASICYLAQSHFLVVNEKFISSGASLTHVDQTLIKIKIIE